MKPDWRFVLAEAERITKGAARHIYTKHDYQGAMLELAKHEAASGESAASSFARLWAGNDARMNTLHQAANSAPLVRPSGDRKSISLFMEDYSERSRRAGESKAQAFDRLLQSDGVMRELYSRYSGAGV